MTYVAKKVKLNLTILMKFNLKYEVYISIKKYKCFLTINRGNRYAIKSRNKNLKLYLTYLMTFCYFKYLKIFVFL